MTIAEILTKYLNQQLNSDSYDPVNTFIKSTDETIIKEMRDLEDKIDLDKLRRTVAEQLISRVGVFDALVNLSRCPPGHIMISADLAVTLVLCSLIRGVEAAQIQTQASQEIKKLEDLFNKTGD